MQLHSLLPVWLALMLIGALLASVVYGAWTLMHKQVRPRWVAILTGLRLAIVAVFAFILLQPVVSYSRTIPRLPELLVLIDSSQSMAKLAGSQTRLEEASSPPS